MKDFKFFGRRDLLSGLGKGSALFLPILKSISASAQGNSPKRVILMCMPNGRSKDQWYGERRSNTDFDLHQRLNPLIPYKQDLVMIRGNYMDIASHRGDGHFHGNVFAYTGFRSIGGQKYAQLSGGPSLEFALQKQLFPEKKVLPIGVGNPGIWRIAWSARQTPANVLDSTQKTFDALFSGFVPPMENSNPPSMQPAQANADLKILDLVSSDIGKLMNRLAASEREVLETHLDSIRTSIRAIEREQQESNSEGGIDLSLCVQPSGPGDNSNYRSQWKAQIDLITNGFACDLTRTVSVQFGWFTHSVNPKVHNFDRNSHDLSHYYEHGGGTRTNYKAGRDAMATQYAQYIAELIEALKARPEGNGTMFDNTMIMWYSEISDGHDFRDMPCILLGSLGGTIRTGQFLDLNGANASQNNVLLAIANAMGWDTNTFGDPNFCNGPTPGLLKV